LAKTVKTQSAAANRPIGVFDSGLGGLTVVREIRRLLPSESIVYFGDLARLPYGIKSKEQILNFSIQNTLFLMKHKVKAVVVACNSSASAAYSFLKKSFSLPVVDVIEPAASMAVKVTRNKRIGVIATQSTVSSGAYERALKKLDRKAEVFQAACSLFVPLVEEGWIHGKITEDIASVYLDPLKKRGFDTLILGCTHYPLLYNVIQKIVGDRVYLIDSAAPTVQKLTAILNQNGLINTSEARGDLKIYVSDMPRNFVKVGETFLGEKLHHVEVVRQKT
jgi:glutamate racemase